MGEFTTFSLSDVACDPTRTADVAALIMQEGKRAMLKFLIIRFWVKGTWALIRIFRH